ncbi:Cys-tRNA(Pro) deacylase [Williamsia maris]|uniref:Cys-tRNA(Pro)/Cys-tRNA(Cys) deacylase n=1 Tax=Williamsia maris TaxID=72806 RepID=A0ABT1HGW3_9NOCA|nr:Cys-tRNA(Pro) deacylase [Williamsia maris]MCP2177493.1 Cys-tRNA(Pro)/Cys-tRNA(Cys) deacylase [Williamsia maris]
MAAATPAITVLEQAGVAHTVHRYRSDPRAGSFGDEAVDALASDLGVDGAQVFKTLVISVSGAGGNGLAVAVIPVPQRLSLKAAAAALGMSKAEMATPDAVRRSTGYVLGGVSPFGQRTPLPTVVDSSAAQWPSMLCSGGRRGLEIELSPTDLIDVTAAVVAPITG